MAPQSRDDLQVPCSSVGPCEPRQTHCRDRPARVLKPSVAEIRPNVRGVYGNGTESALPADRETGATSHVRSNSAFVSRAPSGASLVGSRCIAAWTRQDEALCHMDRLRESAAVGDQAPTPLAVGDALPAESTRLNGPPQSTRRRRRAAMALLQSASRAPERRPSSKV
jgi:hypothetical protein